MIILYIAIVLLAGIIFLLSMALYHFVRKSAYISDREKKFIEFVIDIYTEYGDDLGVQSKEEHKKLCEELLKIKAKYFKTKKEDK
jgi:hypothetical protein